MGQLWLLLLRNSLVLWILSALTTVRIPTEHNIYVLLFSLFNIGHWLLIRTNINNNWPWLDSYLNKFYFSKTVCYNFPFLARKWMMYKTCTKKHLPLEQKNFKRKLFSTPTSAYNFPSASFSTIETNRTRWNWIK